MALFTTPGASLGGIPGSAALARLLVVISGNSQGLVASLGTATNSLSKFHNNANALGNTMTRSVTLPTLALGGVVVKVAGDFEAAMARVAGITDLTATQAARARQEIFDLVASPDIVAGPTELADSLYFAASAGLNDFRKAMEVVELSAKGASVGMGDAADISRILISALNAFEEQGLTAGVAMDALTAAIKAGTAEPDELAISLGRLLPIAAEVGLTFQETVAQVAALTNIGVPTRVATTALRALFNQFLAPTELARENLEKLHISYDDLAEAIHAGPLVAFEMLHRAAKGNNEVIRDIIPQIRALTAFFGLADEKAGDTARVLNLVRDSAGSLDKVLDEFRDTPFFRFQDAIGELKLAAISLGGVVIPIFNQLVSILGDIGQGLQALPDGFKQVAVSVLVLVAALGPALKLFTSLSSSSGIFVGGVEAVGKSFLVLAASATLAVGALGGFAKGEGSILSFALGAVSAFTALSIALGLLRRAADIGALGLNAVSFAIAGLSGGAIVAIAAALTALIGLFVLSARASGRVRREMNEFGEALTNAAANGQTFQQFFRDLRKNVDKDVADEIIRIAKAADLIGKVQVSQSFPQFIHQAGVELATTLKRLEDFGGNIPDTLERAVPVLQNAAREGRDLGAALKRAGLSSAEFFDALESFKSVDPAAGSAELAEEIEKVALAYGEAGESQRDFLINQAATIRAVNLEEGAIQKLADRYGVSYEFMEDKLGEFGVAASELSGRNQQLFLEEAGLVEKTTGREIAARQELIAAEAEVIAKRQESLSSAANFFEEIENITKASSDKISENIRNVTSTMTSFAQNTRILLRRGLDPGALQFLVDQGPAAVARFVDLSDEQLRRWEVNFATAMAAGDAVVLNEGKHLQTKGDAMIAGFVEAILSNKNLGPNAMQQIITAMREKLVAGDLPRAALPMIQAFAENIAKNKNIPKNAVAGIVIELINKLSDKPKFFKSGTANIVAWAQGIASQLGLTKEQAAAVARALLRELQKDEQAKKHGENAVRKYAQGARQQTGLARSAGTDVGNQFRNGLSLSIDTLYGFGVSAVQSFINGINSMGPAVNSAVAKITGDVQHGFGQGLKGSPKFFTYYMGQDLVDQMYQGMRFKERMMRPVVLGNAAATSQAESMDRLANALSPRNKPARFHHDTRGHVKMDSYLVGRTERMNALRREDRP